MIKIVEVKTKKELKKFIYFSLKLYKNSEYFTPPLFNDDYKDFTNKNPSLKNCKYKCFLAYKDNKLVGRLCALINPPADEKFSTKRMRFRHFDAIDDIDVTKALFRKAKEYALENNIEEIEGPNGFTDFDKEGMLYEGFEHKNIFITYYNYPYYNNHMIKIGMKKQVDWFEYRIKLPDKVYPQLDRISQMVQKKGYHVVKFKSRKEIMPYVQKAFKVYNEAFASLYGTVFLSEELVNYYMGSFIPIINSDYICVVEDKNNDVVGFAAVVPSLSNASRSCNGKLFPLGWINLLSALNKNDTIDMLLIAVKPTLQGLGINAILMNEVLKSCVKHGIKYAETGPELEDNLNVQRQWKNYDHELIRKRRLYISKIGDLLLDE